jgi:hypothetical protein
MILRIFLKKGIEFQGDRQDKKVQPACSTFAVLNPGSEKLLAHNADGAAAANFILFCDPPGGYASVTVVNLHQMGFREDRADNLHLRSLENRVRLLDAPYYPHAGMNRYGLAAAEMMAQGGGQANDPAKITLSGTHSLRLILDNAKNVDEAIALLNNYNNKSSSIEHYLIADASGHSVIIEYKAGKMVTTRNKTHWQAATNFRILNAEPRQLLYRCRRYKKAHLVLERNHGQISMQEAMDLLKIISVKPQPWWKADLYTGISIVFNMSSGIIHVVPRMHYDNIHKFQLPQLPMKKQTGEHEPNLKNI